MIKEQSGYARSETKDFSEELILTAEDLALLSTLDQAMLGVLVENAGCLVSGPQLSELSEANSYNSRRAAVHRFAAKLPQTSFAHRIFIDWTGKTHYYGFDFEPEEHECLDLNPREKAMLDLLLQNMGIAIGSDELGFASGMKSASSRTNAVYKFMAKLHKTPLASRLIREGAGDRHGYQYTLLEEAVEPIETHSVTAHEGMQPRRPYVWEPTHVADWQEDALCREIGDLSGPADRPGHPVQTARFVCGQCAVADQCLAAYLDEPNGFYGGLSKNERQRIRNMRASGTSEQEVEQVVTDIRRRGYENGLRAYRGKDGLTWPVDSDEYDQALTG